MSEDAVENNDHMPRYCYDFVKDICELYTKNQKNCTWRGIWAASVTRFSPVEDFYNRLSADDHDIFCQDPYLDFWAEVGIKVQSSIKNFLIITMMH